MKLGRPTSDFFALDIGTTTIRVVELSPIGKTWRLIRFASNPIDIHLSESSADSDVKKLGEAITAVIDQAGIRSKNVVVGIPSTKMFATVVEMPAASKAELANIIKYQADTYVPMSPDEAKIDWTVVGKSPQDNGKIEVLIASVPNSFAEARLDLLEGLGLNAIALEPDSLALVRALLPGDTVGGCLIIDMGDLSTDIVMTLADTPRLMRSIPVGLTSFIRAAEQGLPNMTTDQVRELLLKFGIEGNKLDGQVASVVRSITTQLDGEVMKSIKFFESKYPGLAISGALLSGYASTMPGLAYHVSQQTGLETHLASPWQRVEVPIELQPGLAPLAPQFAVAVGLAERTK